MKSFFVSLVVAACAVHEAAAFSTLPSSPRPLLTPLNSATVGTSSGTSPRNNAVPPSPRSPSLLEQREMETIHRELVEKYIKLGHTEEYAAREVNYFLEDSERSAQFVEMRRVAMKRGNDLGIENFVQFFAAFMVGMMGSWLLNSFHAMQMTTFS